MPGKVPSLVRVSVWQIPQAGTLMRTWPPAGSGTSRSMISRGPFGRGTWTTRMVDIGYLHAAGYHGQEVDALPARVARGGACTRDTLDDAHRQCVSFCDGSKSIRPNVRAREHHPATRDAGIARSRDHKRQSESVHQRCDPRSDCVHRTRWAPEETHRRIRRACGPGSPAGL